MIHLKIEEVAGKKAILLDDAVLMKLGASLGDTLVVEEAAVSIETNLSEVERQLQLAREIMGEYRETLEALAR
jgi:hypothetical protein